MEKHIEILKNWLKKQNNIYAEKYGDVDPDIDPTDNIEKICRSRALDLHDRIKMWSKKLKKMENGKQMHPKFLKTIESL